MKNFYVLTEAIAFLEENLESPISRGDAAKHCHVSLSSLEKLFRYALHLGLGEYLSKRRLTRAARDLADGAAVLKTAMKYQYDSAEGFSRAFRRFWGVCPSEFAEKWKFTGLLPKLNFHYEEGGDMTMARKMVDLSDAYDFFRQNEGTQVICFDVKNLTGYNEISHRAGDLAIRETARRIDEAAGEEMLTLRIGGDEFALVTCLRDPAAAERLRQEVLSHNGETFAAEGQELPLSLWGGITTIPERLRYKDFFTDLHHTIETSKT